MKCDIIIPIYNAYDCLKPCIESVLDNTDMEQNRLILIDDKSTDARVLPLLEKYENGKNIILLKNKDNKGFVGTVNVGMRYSKNDVLLLNSDTEVTKNWLNKMQTCAYSNKMVATVTPLSNNATLASVPLMFVKNEIPKGFTLQEMADIVEKASTKDYPELPTGHGFCLYIKRSVLKEIGLFDEIAFKKGYGEENDFCFRCLDKGYRNLLCDDTYIYHKESQSFSETKYELMKNGENILNNRYPEFKSKLQTWCNQRPLDYIGAKIGFEIGKKNLHPNILYIVHDFENFSTNKGGTTLHCWDIIKNLRNKYNFHVLSYSAGIYKITSIYENSEFEYKVGTINNFNKFTFYNNQYKRMVQKIIDSYSIQMIHIHHMQFHYFDLIDIIKENKIPTYLSLHDCYCVCPLIMKMYNYKEYCGIPTIQECCSCLKEARNIKQNIICDWRNNYRELFKVCKKIIVPHESAKEEILKTYKSIENLIVIEHGEDVEKEYSKLSIEGDKEVNIAFVGAIGIHKGRNILVDLVENEKKLGKIKIHLFGVIDNYNRKNTKHYINHGLYKREELNTLLKENNIKLVCLFSVCPETFSYTLTETVAAGIPVLGINLGAIGSRIKQNKLGWTIKYNSTTKEYIEKIKSIVANPKEYKEIIKNINKYHIKNTKEMAEDYSDLYKISKISKSNEEMVLNLINNSTNYTCQPVNGNYEWLFNTLKWKLFTVLKIPKPIKKIYKKIRGKK